MWVVKSSSRLARGVLLLVYPMIFYSKMCHRPRTSSRHNKGFVTMGLYLLKASGQQILRTSTAKAAVDGASGNVAVYMCDRRK